MTARQFGFVIARGLAIYSFFIALGDLQKLVYFKVEAAALTSLKHDGLSNSLTITLAAGVVVFTVLATFLWTSADRFGGKIADGQPRLRAGNWVVQLAFTCLAILIMLFGISGVVSSLVQNPLQDAVRLTWDLVPEGIKFLVGLGLFIAYRFDKKAALQAAQAIEPETPLP